MQGFVDVTLTFLNIKLLARELRIHFSFSIFIKKKDYLMLIFR